MIVKVNTSLAGDGFSFNFGAEVDSDEFSALVGNGWETLCDPVAAEPADEPEFETTDLLQGAETTDAAPSRRGRRK
jgi:hypothetical protein